MRRGRVLIMGLALTTGLLAGCSSSGSSKSSDTTPVTTAGGGVTVPSTGGTTVNVTVGDTKGLDGPMTMVLSPASVPAGDVTFVVKNAGTIEHEVIVLKTTTPYDKLPVTDAGDPPVKVTTGANKVDETDNIGETGDPNPKPGATKSFTIKAMKAGSYALVCNIAQHYGKGMRAAFTVTG